MAKKHRKQVLLRETQGGPTLSELVKQDAENVMKKSKLTGESSALLEAAIDPGPELRGRNDPLDAEVIADAELAAGELLAEGEGPEGFMGTGEQTQRQEREPFDVSHASWMCAVVRDAGLWMLDGGKKLQLRAIAFGNDVLDWFQKQRTAYVQWRTRTHDNLLAWAIKADAEFKDWLKRLDAWNTNRLIAKAELMPLSKAFFKMSMDDLKEDLAAELRRQTKRSEELERQVAKLTRAVNRINAMTSQVDTEDLNLFVQAINQGRKTNATALYRKLTGVSLDAAKGALETMGSA